MPADQPSEVMPNQSSESFEHPVLCCRFLLGKFRAAKLDEADMVECRPSDIIGQSAA